MDVVIIYNQQVTLEDFIFPLFLFQSTVAHTLRKRPLLSLYLLSLAERAPTPAGDHSGPGGHEPHRRQPFRLRGGNVLNSGLSHLVIYVQKQAIAGYNRL